MPLGFTVLPGGSNQNYDPEYNSYPYPSNIPANNLVPNAPLSPSLSLSPSVMVITDPNFNVSSYVASLVNKGQQASGSTSSNNNLYNNGYSNNGNYDPEYNSYPYPSNIPANNLVPNAPLSPSLSLSPTVTFITDPNFNVSSYVASLVNHDQQSSGVTSMNNQGTAQGNVYNTNNENSGYPISGFQPSANIQPLMVLGADVNAIVAGLVQRGGSAQYVA